MTKIPPTRDELVDQLERQIGYLQRSAVLFDSGYTEEAARLAVTLRVLLHDTASSHSLLGQLGVKEVLRFVDTAADLAPEVEGTTLIVRFEQPGLVELDYSQGPRYVAPLRCSARAASVGIRWLVDVTGRGGERVH